MSVLERLKAWAGRIKRDVHALYFAARDPRVPWPVKLLAISIVAYAFSPIDLIPDFIPVLGLVDDAILIPLGVLMVVRLIPPEVMAEHRSRAASAAERPSSVAGAVAIIAIWLVSLVLVSLWLWPRLARGGH